MESFWVNKRVEYMVVHFIELISALELCLPCAYLEFLCHLWPLKKKWLSIFQMSCLLNLHHESSLFYPWAQNLFIFMLTIHTFILILTVHLKGAKALWAYLLSSCIFVGVCVCTFFHMGWIGYIVWWSGSKKFIHQ